MPRRKPIAVASQADQTAPAKRKPGRPRVPGGTTRPRSIVIRLSPDEWARMLRLHEASDTDESREAWARGRLLS